MPAPCKATNTSFGIVIEVLADDEDGLAVAVAVRVRERDVGRERNVAGHLLPEITELVAHIPDIVAGGVDGVLLRAGVVTGAARQQRAANVGLALKQADRRVEIPAGPVKIRRRRDLDMIGRTGLRPRRHDGCGVGGLRAEQIRLDTKCQGQQRESENEFHNEVKLLMPIASAAVKKNRFIKHRPRAQLPQRINWSAQIP